MKGKNFEPCGFKRKILSSFFFDISFALLEFLFTFAHKTKKQKYNYGIPIFKHIVYTFVIHYKLYG